MINILILFIFYNLILLFFSKKIPEDKKGETTEEIQALTNNDENTVLVLAFGKDELLITTKSKVKNHNLKSLKNKIKLAKR
jgi:hypothetical protein